MPHLGSIGAEIRRSPRLKFNRRYLPEIGTKTCRLFDKPSSANAKLGPDTGDKHQKAREKKGQAMVEPKLHMQKLVISLPPQSEDVDLRKSRDRVGATGHSRLLREGGDPGLYARKNHRISQIQSVTTPVRRYVMTWADHGGETQKDRAYENKLFCVDSKQ